MKKLVFCIALVLIGPVPALSNPDAGVSFDLFYSSLGPYGNWISVEGGVYAWQPAGVEQGWRPYYDGHWIWTDDGWYWDSDEPWAWATYHYGRWYDDDYYGWVWIPGYDWAPAWVEWRFGGGAMGWAPLGPYALFSIGWGIHYTHPWVTPLSYWTFVDCRWATMPVHRYAYRFDENSRWFGRTRGAGSVWSDGRRVITRGPEPGYVERSGNVRIERTEIREVPDRRLTGLNRGSDGRDQIEVYRPRFDTNPARNDAVRPPNVRQGGRPLSLDTRNTDALRRNVARDQGRDLQRAEEYRARRVDPGPGYGRDGGGNYIQRTPDPRSRTLDRQSERKAIEERAPRAPDRSFNRIPDRRNEPIDRPPRIDQMQRSNPPERTMRRPDSNPSVGRGDRGFTPPQPSSRGNEGNRGGGGGGRRDKSGR